ncbi:hypothetical protein MMC25_002203 [Agyrium rufum]|nr:hypothetical protein [Agyrium rufum]
MAQPTQHFPPRPFSPAQPPYPPPTGNYMGPPNKRIKLSPSPQSPQSSPTQNHAPLPSQVFSSPYAASPVNGTRPYESPHTPMNPLTSMAPPSAPSGPSGQMGPPSKPVENRPTDMNEITDVLTGSGIDLREEEAALVNRNNQTSGGSGYNYQGQNGAYSASLYRATPASQIYSPGDYLSNNVPGGKDSFYGAGTFNQPAVPAEDPDVVLERQRKRAIRVRAERKQYTLNDPFLQGGPTSKKIFKHTAATAVKLESTGLLKAQPGQPMQMKIHGPDRHEILMMLKGEDLLTHASPMSEILGLLSLATQDRLRMVVEDTVTLARGRRVGSHGQVPAELVDLAIGLGPSKGPGGQEAQKTVPSGLANGHKDNAASSPLPALTFTNPILKAMQEITAEEKAFEEKRLAKRAKRAERLEPGEGTPATPGSTGLLGVAAPEIDPKKPASKKEQKKQADAKVNEFQQSIAQRSTLQMAMGGRSVTKSWMTSSKPAAPTGFPVNKPKPSSQAKADSKVQANGKIEATKKAAGNEKREDKEMGAGVQMRDIIMALADEPKERKSLARAYRKLDSRPVQKIESRAPGT